MIRHSTRRFWKRRFALLPITLNDGPNRTFIWLEWVWVSTGPEWTEVSLADPDAPSPTERPTLPRDELEATIKGLKAERDEWKAAVDKNWPGVYAKWMNACGRAEDERVRANLAEDRANALQVEVEEAASVVRDLLEAWPETSVPAGPLCVRAAQIVNRTALTPSKGQGQ